MVDLLLLKYCDVKKRSDRCFAVAQSYAVDVGDLVLVEDSNRQLEVVKISRGINFDTVSIIEEKNKLHKVCCVVNISYIEIPITVAHPAKEDYEC